MRPESVTTLYHTLETYYNGMHGQMQRNAKLYYRQLAGLLTVPEGVKIHESSTSSLIVDSLRDQIRTDEPVVSYSPRGTSRAARHHQNLMQLWGQHLMKDLAGHSVADPISQAVFDLLLRGQSAIKCVVDTDRLPVPPIPSALSKARYNDAVDEYEQSIRTYWPWVCKAIDPLNIFICPGSQVPPRYVIERQTRYAMAIESAYPEWVDPHRGRSSYSPNREVLWLEYWDADDYVTEVDGQVIEKLSKPNPYGVIPYVTSYSGLGRQDADGDPTHLAIGILSTISGELEEEIRIKTAQASQWLYFVYPILLTPDVPATVRAQMISGPGSIMRVNPETHQATRWLEVPAPTQQMVDFLREVQQNIFRKVSPALMERPAGVDAGIHQALLVGQALKVISPIKTAINRMGSQLLNLMAQQTGKLQMKMSVKATLDKTEKEYMIEPTAFHPLNFSVTYEATDPAENDRHLAVGLSVLRVPGLMSRETWRDKFAKAVIPDPEAEEVKLLAEQAVDQYVAAGGLLQLIGEQVARLQTNRNAAQLPAATPPSRGQVAEAAGELAPGTITSSNQAAQEALQAAPIQAAEGQRNF